MSAMEAWIFAYLLNAAWQVLLIPATAWTAARVLRGEHPRVEYRMWVGALLAAVVVPACDLRRLELARHVRELLWWGHGGQSGGAHVDVTLGPNLVLQGTDGIGGWLMHGIVLAFAAGVVFAACRMVWGLRETHRLARTAVPLNQGSTLWLQCCADAGVSPAACRLAVSEEVGAPLTVGVLRASVLVPPVVLENAAEEDLRTVFTHELVHVRRHDFGWNLLLGVLALPLFWHPVMRLVRRRIAESRELVCDATTAELGATRLDYARSLVRLASLLAPALTPRANIHAVGIFDGHTFERRVMTLTRRTEAAGSGRRMAHAALCGLLTLVAAGTALALHTGVVEPSSAKTHTSGGASGPVRVDAGVAAGEKVSGDVPTYPAEAKKNKVQGAVVLKAVISKTGEIEQLVVVSGPKELRASAINAVRTWQYRPYLLNGEAVEVETTITVNYNLQG